MEHGVQESLDWEENVEGTDNVLLESVIGYARFIRTTLLYEIKED